MDSTIGVKDEKEPNLKKSERWWISLADAEEKPDWKVSNNNYESVDSSIPLTMEVSPASIGYGETENTSRSTKRVDESPELSDGEESEEEIAVVEPSAPKEGSDVVICVPVSEGKGRRRAAERGKMVGRSKGNVGEERVSRHQPPEIGVLFGGETERIMPIKGKSTEENVDPIRCAIGDAEMEKGKVCLKGVSIECVTRKRGEMKSIGTYILGECPKDAGFIKTNVNGSNPVEDVGKEYQPDISASETKSVNHSTQSKITNHVGNESQYENCTEVFPEKEDSDFTMKKDMLYSEAVNIDEKKDKPESKSPDLDSSTSERELTERQEDVDYYMNIEGIILRSLHEVPMNNDLKHKTKQVFRKSYDGAYQAQRPSKDRFEAFSRKTYSGAEVTNYYDFQKSEAISPHNHYGKKSSKINGGSDIRAKNVTKNGFFSENASQFVPKKFELNKNGRGCFAGDLETTIGGKRLRIFFQSAENAREVVTKTNSMARGKIPHQIKVTGYKGMNPRRSSSSSKKHLRNVSHKSSAMMADNTRNMGKDSTNSTVEGSEGRGKEMGGDSLEISKISGEENSEEHVEAEVIIENFLNRNISSTSEDIQEMTIRHIKLDPVTNNLESESEGSTETEAEVISFDRGQGSASGTDEIIMKKTRRTHGVNSKVVKGKTKEESHYSEKGNGKVGTRWRTEPADDEEDERQGRKRHFLRRTRNEKFSSYETRKAEDSSPIKSSPRNKLKFFTNTGNKEKTFGKRMRNLFSATFNRLRL